MFVSIRDVFKVCLGLIFLLSLSVLAVKYNWWYYRPISLPDEVEFSSDSVTYVGSYC